MTTTKIIPIPDSPAYSIKGDSFQVRPIYPLVDTLCEDTEQCAHFVMTISDKEIEHYLPIKYDLIKLLLEAYNMHELYHMKVNEGRMN
jgi:uncharacterized membrane protein